MPQPEWHIERYQEALRLLRKLDALEHSRRTHNVPFAEECHVSIAELTTAVKAIRS